MPPHLPRRRSYETLVCSLVGHVTPAAAVAALRPQDARLGIDLDRGGRLCRCLRCDAWVEAPTPIAPSRAALPELEQLDVPRRGQALREALALRLIAIDRGLHAVLFGVAAIALGWLDLKLGGLRAQAGAILDAMSEALSTAGRDASRGFIVRSITRISHLQHHTLTILALTALAYCLVEGIEAVGLWRERRWAAYLTVLATAGFLPFELVELTRRLTVFRFAALALNLAILVYLLYRERLFGLRGGAAAKASERIDRQALFGGPPAARAAPPPIASGPTFR